jgi:hypothetical protein
MRSPRNAMFAAALLVLLSAFPTSGHAYGFSGAGGKLGFTSPEDHDEAVMVGGHLEFAEPGQRLHLLPNMMYWKANRTSDVNTNMDLYYHFERPGSTTPYVGGGLGLNWFSNDITDHSETDLGANVFGGVRIPAGANHYFVEGRFTASDISQVSLLGGVTFGVH